MPTTFRKRIAISLACTLSLMAAACSGWQGSQSVDTDPGGDALGHGPGLFSGKEGGFVIYKEPWTGTVPGGGVAE